MKSSAQTNILIAGGSGHWSELNHYPAIQSLKGYGAPIKVAAICDTVDPRKKTGRPSLASIIKNDNSVWINPSGKSEGALTRELSLFHKKNHIDIMLVSTNPVHHYFYNFFGAKNKINVLCDKPLVITKDASFDISRAKQISSQYRMLKKLVLENQRSNPSYTFCLPLRRRALKPFVIIAENLEEIYRKTGEGIRHMNVIINGGVHKYPIEFLKGGAHGYTDGFGSLSHSSYHYIDVIAWYLSTAKGSVSKIKVELPYVFRVSDYLRIKGYQKLHDLIEANSSTFSDKVELPKKVLNAELDFTFHLKLLDKQNNLVGLVSYTSNHTTFTPRLTQYFPEMTEYTNDRLGGRMSQIYFDIHQGAIQNWQLKKNDVVFQGNTIDIIGRRHPKLGKQKTKMHFADAYDKNTITPKDLTKVFIKHCAGFNDSSKDFAYLSSLDNQELTNQLFSKFYEKIAEEFHNKYHPQNRIHVNTMIDIEQKSHASKG